MTETLRNRGRQGEDMAAAYLQANGYRILARNFKTAVGEIDIVAQEGRDLVFIEVKSGTARKVWPASRVDRAKCSRISSAAEIFLAYHHLSKSACRFEVIAIHFPSQEITHFRQEFLDP